MLQGLSRRGRRWVTDRLDEADDPGLGDRVRAHLRVSLLTVGPPAASSSQKDSHPNLFANVVCSG